MLNKRKKEIGGFHKYLIPLLLCGVFLFFCGVRAQAQELPSISAQSAALLVADTGEFLFEKNAQQQRGMASTTKIMTSLLAVEESDPNRVITATEAMVRVEGTSIGLQAGDKITLRNLIYGMLLESGNDAANATAIALAGSADQFAERMNAPLAIIDKRRPKANVSEVMNIIGDVRGKHVILLDDMVDTGGSLCHAAQALMEIGGAQDVTACASHGVLSGPAIDRINSSVLDEVIFLDTIPAKPGVKCDKIKYLSSAPMLADAISFIYHEDSVSRLFV